MLGSVPQSQSAPPTSKPGRLPPLPPSIAMLVSPHSAPASHYQPNPAARAVLADLQRKTIAVETVVYVWERMMYAIAGMLALAAIISWATRRPRGPHLVAATVALLGTCATLGAMVYLSHPKGGGLPPLPMRTYALTGIALSAYAFVALAAYLRGAARADRLQ